LIEQDIPNNRFARMKDGEIIIKENTAIAPEPAAREKYRKKI
jgi:hypothetical protein